MLLLYIAFVIVLVLGDQLLKWYIFNTLARGETMAFIPGIVQLTHVQNTGIAFGLLRDFQWIPMVLNPIIVLGLVLLMWRGIIADKAQRWAMSAIIAGALGNLIDRFVHGFVLDMFDLLFIRFAVFNLADSFITLGAIALIIAYVREELRQRRPKADEAESDGSA